MCSLPGWEVRQHTLHFPFLEEETKSPQGEMTYYKVTERDLVGEEA